MSRGWHEGHCVKKVSESCQDFAKTVSHKRARCRGAVGAIRIQLELEDDHVYQVESGIAFGFGFARTHMTRMISEFFDHGPGIVVTDTE